MTDCGRAVPHVLKMQTDSLVHAKAINCLAVASQQSLNQGENHVGKMMHKL